MPSIHIHIQVKKKNNNKVLCQGRKEGRKKKNTCTKNYWEEFRTFSLGEKSQEPVDKDGMQKFITFSAYL